MTFLLLCILRSTVPIDREMYLRLFGAAQAMRASGGARSYDLDGAEFSGCLTTSWASGSVGTFCGPKFCANLEVGGKTGRAEFIVPERYLDEEFGPADLHVL